MKIKKQTKDFNGTPIRVGDIVFSENGEQGTITNIYDDNTIDIHHSNAHQGPVIDTFNIKYHKIMKLTKE